MRPTRKRNVTSSLLMRLHNYSITDPGVLPYELKRAAIENLEPYAERAYTVLWDAREWLDREAVAAALNTNASTAGHLLSCLYGLGLVKRERRPVEGKPRAVWFYHT